jgi:hypothetical protein
VLSDEVSRRDGLATTLRAQKAQLDPQAQLENSDSSAKVTFERALLNELSFPPQRRPYFSGTS